MAQPDFLGDGHTQRRSDTKWLVWAKTLGEYQDSLGGSALAANNPRRSDTLRILKQKLLCAIDGVTYTG